MNWFYAKDGKQTGPVDEAEFTRLIRQGQITTQTLVWREGLEKWQPWGEMAPPLANQAPPGETPGTALPAGTVVCAECGKSFNVDDVVRYGDVTVCGTCKPLFLQKIKEGALLTGDQKYAGFGTRFAAKFVDGLLIGLPLYLLFLLVLIPASQGGDRRIAFLTEMGLSAALIAVNLIYNSLMLGKYGATLGKMACKIRVVTADGGRISYSRALGRSLAEILSGWLLYIGYIIAAFDRQKRTLHDHIARTRVIRVG